MFIAHNIGASRSPADDFWYGSAAGLSSSGALVSSDTALRLSTVYKCVRVRAETIGMLPLQVYRRLPQGGKEADDAHHLSALLHDMPNPWQTAMQWRSMMQAHLDLRGNAYSEIVFNGAGREDMLIPLHPDSVCVEVLPSGVPRFKVREKDGRDRILVFGEVLHVAGLSVDGYCGMNPIEAEREAIGAAMSTRDYGSRYFANNARPPMWIKMPNRFASQEDKATFVTQFSKAYGGMNSGKTPVMEQGMELHSIPISNVDAQFLDSRKAQDIDIAGIFRMPPHKIGILDRATWGNIEHQQLDFVTDTILPSAVAWEQALLRDLNFGDGYFAEFKLAMLLRGDTKTRFEAYGKGIQDGWLTRNEARSMENLNSLPGLDEPLVPMNMAPAGSRGVDQARGTQPSNGGRHAMVLAAAAERVARKEVALIGRASRSGGAVDLQSLFEGHAAFVEQVMAVAPELASRHVADTIERAEDWIAKRALEADVFDAQTTALMRLEN